MKRNPENTAMNRRNTRRPATARRRETGMRLALGAGFGVALGSALGNLALGLAIGIAIGGILIVLERLGGKKR